MARIKPQEIIRRVGTATRQSERPDLVVAADQDSARGYSALSSVAADTLNRASSVFTAAAAEKKVRKDAADETEGALKRSQDDLSGNGRMGAEDIAQMTEAWRRGYLKTDGALRLRDWQAEAVSELAKAEPGSDIEPILKAKLGELMEAPEFQDQAVKAALMPAVMQAADAVRGAWQKQEIAETVTRQEESATALAATMIRDKSLLTDEGQSKLYALLGSEEYAFLDRRDIDGIVARASMQVLESGDADPDEVLAFLGKARPDGTPGVLHNKQWADQLDNAARAGRNVIAARAEAARDQAMAEAEFKLQDLADRGQMTDKVITETADRFGLQGKERIQYIRYWGNQQEQTLRRWEQERKEAARHAETLRALSGNPYEVGMAKAKKAAEKEWASVTGTPEQQKAQRAALIKKYAKLNVPIPQMEAVFDSMTSASLPTAARAYMALHKIDPAYAAAHLSDGKAGMLWQHAENVGRLGMTEEDSVRSLGFGTPSAARSQVAPYVTKALNDHFKAKPTLPNGKPRTPEMTETIRRLALADAVANPGVPMASVISAAEARASTRFTTVGGKVVPRGELMPGGEAHLEKALEHVRSSLVARGVVHKDMAGEIRLEPNRHSPDQWVVTNHGYPVRDPDTGKPAVFFPNDLAAAYVKWETAKADAKTRGDQAYRQIYGRGPFKPEADFEEARTELPKKIAEAERQLARLKPDMVGARASKTRELEGMRARYQGIQRAAADIPRVPSNFLDYLKENR